MSCRALSRGLVAKVVWSVLPVGAALAFLLSIVGLCAMRLHEIDRQLDSTQRLLQVVESTVSIACFTEDVSLAREIADGLLSSPTVGAVRIASLGTLLADKQRNATRPVEEDPRYQVRRKVFSPFDPSEPVGEVILQADADAIRSAAQGYSVFVALVLTALALGVTAVVALVVYRVVVRPIRHFARDMDALAGQVHGRLEVPRGHAHNEIGSLVTAFNRLMESIAGMLRQEYALREQMSQSEQRYRTLAENSPDLIVRHDLRQNVVYANPVYLQKVGAAAGPWRPSMPLVQFQQHLREAVRTGRTDTLLWDWVDAQGDTVCHEMQVVPEYDADGRPIGTLTMGRDITDRLEAQRRLLHQATHDDLTGLSNRAAFQEHLQQRLAHARRDGTELALLFIDLDNFKSINDTLGHAMGDDLLRLLAQRMQATLRETDMIARLGGDEFVVLLDSAPPRHQLPVVVQKVFDAVAAPCVLGHQRLFPSASVGVAVFPGDGQDVAELMRNADVAMYAAKAQGRHGYRFYAADMNEGAQEWLRLSHDLRLAIERGEFELHYQPKAEVATGAFTGMEALIRWRHPELGVVSPVRFIAVAEECGLIADIDAWVLNEACRQMREWIDAGLAPGRVAINLSAAQCSASGFAERVNEALGRHGVNAHCLELEITETTLMTEAADAIRAFWRLREQGVRVAVDDFGTGYSSLSYLRRLPVDHLKIDKSFVDELETDANDREITKAIVAMASSLGLAAVAEGVERASQLALLREMGCHQFQGYLCSRPLPAAEMTRMLEAVPVPNESDGNKNAWKGRMAWAA
ncbi:putative bifunctional diguanylate cyclase/phosphodiesterase [Hydrogenophaga aquatica]